MKTSRLRRLGVWLLRISLPAGDVGRTIQGDLLEEYEQVPAGLAADVRFCTSAIALAVTYGVRQRVKSLRGGREHATEIGRECVVAIRRLSQRPAQSFLFVMTLAIGIAVNTILFTMVEAILIRPLPFAAGDDLRQVVVEKVTGELDPRISIRDLMDIRKSPAIAVAAGWHWWDPTISGPDVERERLAGLAVTDGFFELFDLSPAMGRFFGTNDSFSHDDDVVVLSWGFWRRVMGGDPGIVGREVRLNGVSRPVIGVGPAWLPTVFPGIGRVDFWVPTEYRAASRTTLPARTKAGITVGIRPAGAASEAGAARSVADAIRLDVDEASDPVIAGRSFHAPTLHSLATGDISRMLWYFQIAMAGVLVIALANLGGVVLSWLDERRGELALRVALGASRARLTRMLGVECLLLSTFGGLAGLALAAAFMPSSNAALRSAIPAGFAVSMNPAVPLATFGFTVLSAVALSSAPLLALRDRKASQTVGAMGRSTGDGISRMHNALAVGQIGLSFAVVVTAALLVRSYRVLDRRSTGLRGEVIGMRVQALSSSFPTVASQRAFYGELTRRIALVPGVDAVGSINGAPLSGTSLCGEIRSEEDPERFAEGGPCAELRAISHNYFDVVGIPLLRGRLFTPDDREGAEPVAAISETTARLLWPHEDPIGRRFSFGSGGDRIRVVAVVARVTQNHPGEGAVYQIYRPTEQWHSNSRTLVMRPSRSDGEDLVPRIREVVRSLDPRVPVDDVGTLEALRQASLSEERLRASVMGSAAGVTLVLALAGLYGVVASVVARKRREIAVRLTLGATPRGMVLAVIASALRITMLGLVIGSLGALAAAFALTPLLAGVSFFDLPSLTASLGLFVGLTLLGAGLPASRVARIDPMHIIRDTRA